MQQSFIQDSTLSDRLFTLLETTFSGITQKAEFIKQLGASWELVSTPFIQFQDGVAIAHVGVLELHPEKAVFFFNEANQPLYYAEDLDAIAVMEIEGNQLRLFDIVAPHLCSLTAILERIAKPIDEVAIYFSPDSLNVDAQPVPHVLDGDSLLMVRGSFAEEGEPFMLPRSARC